MDNGKSGASLDQQAELGKRVDRVNSMFHSASELAARVSEVADRVFGGEVEAAPDDECGIARPSGSIGYLDGQLDALEFALRSAHAQLNRIQSL